MSQELKNLARHGGKRFKEPGVICKIDTDRKVILIQMHMEPLEREELAWVRFFQTTNTTLVLR